MAQKLFIAGLAFSTSTERLREVLAPAGQELDGRTLKVEHAKPAGPGDGSRSDRGQSRSRW